MSAGQSAETAAAVPRVPRVLFSSGQIVFTTFLLGPLPPLYMYASNLRALGQARLLRIVVFGGYTLLMLEILLVYFIPSHGAIGPTLLSINTGTAGLAFMYQPDWSAIARSDGYVRAPMWRVAWVGVVRTLEFLVWIVLVFALLDCAGFHFVR